MHTHYQELCTSLCQHSLSMRGTTLHSGVYYNVWIIVEPRSQAAWEERKRPGNEAVLLV